MVREIEDYVHLSEVQDFIKRLTVGKAGREKVGTREAYGRVAAENVASPSNVPDRPRSHMDGYALMASDLRGASSPSPRVLQLKEKRGTSGQAGRIRSGETMRVATGEYLPSGADSVSPIEDAKRVDEKVFFKVERRRGDYCYATGSDIREGYPVVVAGRTIRAQDVGLLVLLGVKSLEVYSRPRVALIATGNELTSDIDSDDPSKVRESHTPILENLIQESGGEPVAIGLVPDEISRIVSALEQGIEKSELVLTLGGTSLGERDLVEEALQVVDQKSRIIHGIRMDRGRVSGAASVKGIPVLMLPGPVQAAINAFVLLGIPAIWRLSGRNWVSGPGMVATLMNDWGAREKFETFTKVVYVRLVKRKGRFVAYPVLKDTESMSILTESNGFVVVPERTTKLRAGTQVSVTLLPGFSYVRGRFLNEG